MAKTEVANGSLDLLVVVAVDFFRYCKMNERNTTACVEKNEIASS